MTSFMKEYEHLKIQLKEIKSATNNFDENKVIGKGGFGKVYEGELCHSNSEKKSLVALKRLDRKHGQGDPQFWKEIMMLSRYRHKNLISLLGYCIEDGEMILIYEHASRGSLDHYLKDANLTWTARIKICLDAAKGLSFLHDPNERQQRVLHCDIKSANILLDDNLNAKVSDFGLSKMGSTGQQYSVMITNAVGTPGYCDPLYMETYQLTKESDVYSFGVVLFEVLCGRPCVEFSNGKMTVYVPYWKKAYEDKELLDGIVLEDLKKQMAPTSFEMFTDIAYQCLKKLREERPAMSLVVKNLERALEVQEPYDSIWMIPKEYQEIANAAVDRLVYRSLEELKVLLSKGYLVNDGKLWLSINDKEERCVLISIEECLIQDSPNTSYNDNVFLRRDSRFPVGYYKAEKMKFKLRIRTPLFLSPDVTYGLNLVFHYSDSEREKIKEQHVGIMYKFEGETKISVLHFEDRKEYKRLVAGLYQFTISQECISDFEILLEDCGFSGDLYIEGIEFQPLENVVIANKEIVRAVTSPLFYGFTKEPEVLFSQGVLLNKGKTWLSLNNRDEHCVTISIKDCLIQDDPERDYSYQYSFEKNSRFTVGCYRTREKCFKICVPTPLLLSPNVKYGLNLVFHYEDTEWIKQEYVHVRYTSQGEKKISVVYFADRRKDGWLVAELYQCTSESVKSITDLEIIFEWFHISNYSYVLYIEGIELQPLERVEHPAVEYEEILKAAVPHVFYRSAEELKVLLLRGFLLNAGKMWFSINDNEEHCLMLPIEDCLIRDDPNIDYSAKFFSKKNSRFVAGSFKEHMREFKIRVMTPLFLSPHVTYAVNLVYHIERFMADSVPTMYKLHGVTKILKLKGDEDKREDGWCEAVLYYFVNEADTTTRILDLEIIFEDRLSRSFYMEGIEFQPLGRVEHPVVAVECEEILKAAATPLLYRSTEELKLLLTRGILLNGGQTLLFYNEKGPHTQRIFIEACLTPDEVKLRLRDDYLSFRIRLYEYKYKFKATVRGEYLTPQTSYIVKLFFICREGDKVNVYKPVRYKVDGENETKVYMIYPTNMLSDDSDTVSDDNDMVSDDNEWFMVPFYGFTSQHKTADLQFEFEHPEVALLLVGFDLQPCEEKVDHQVFEEYQDIVEVASQSLFYKSIDELKQILSIGVYLNGYKTWFSLNEKGERCHLISMKDCLISDEDFTYQYKSDRRSRFPAGLYQTNNNGFKIHVKTQLLSPSITYTINIVFYGTRGKTGNADLKYRLREDMTTSKVYLTKRRYRDAFYMAELYQFTSDGRIVDLEIIFENSGTYIDGIEGILFEPMEKVRDQLLEDDKVEDVGTISDSDTYWEQKIPNDYEEILKLSKDSLEWKTKKELYSILCKGFLLDNGQEWFSADKNGKKCQMISARAASVTDDNNSTWESSNESRFGEVLVISGGYKFRIVNKIETKVLSCYGLCAIYFVYKLPQDQSTFEDPLKVKLDDSYFPVTTWFVYLVSPPNTPVIGPNSDENSYRPLNRNELNAVPRHRSDGWMEVEVMQSHSWNWHSYMSLKFKHPGKKDLSGLRVQGIELRSI